MVNDFKKFINENKLFGFNDKILLAISGGIDSMVMLDLFVKCKYNFAIAHVNFNLRGYQSDNDELFVKEKAAELNVPFYQNQFNTKKYAQNNKVSIEMAARALRYSWFEDLIIDLNYQYIAVAHHKDDVVETFFINLTRGTGIRGLTGIKAKNKSVIRPLLFAFRNEIHDYAVENDVEYRTDTSNNELVYNRNKFRHKIIPEFEKINPAFKNNMMENIDRFKELEDILERSIMLESYKCIQNIDNEIYININYLNNLNPIKTYLFEFLRPYNFSSKIIDDIIINLNNISGKQFFSSTHRLIKDREHLIINKIQENLNIEFFINKADLFKVINKNKRDEIRLEIKHLRNINLSNLIKDENYAYLDIEKLKFPLKLRKWEKGDSFVPLGMSKSKKLSDFFIDVKMSITEKEMQWVLESNNEIIWIVGKRINDKYKITSKTKQAIQIKLL